MPDIRVDVNFPHHRKTKKLIQRLGFQGPTHLVFLWATTSGSRPRGILTGMDENDIAIDAQWPGSPGEFVRALVDVGFLEWDENEKAYVLHDWEKHQPFVFHSEERSNQAREAINKRWEKVRSKQAKNKKPIRTVYEPYTEPNTPSPIPSPIPLPKKINTIPPQIDEVIRYCQERKNGVDPHKWFDYYAAKGWLVGKSKMVDWKAAIRTWEHNEENKTKVPDGYFAN